MGGLIQEIEKDQLRGDAPDFAPGDTVRVRAASTPYLEKLVFPRSGAPGAPIRLEAWPGEQPVVDGTGVAGDHLVLIENRSWVEVVGLELRNSLDVNDGSGIRVTGAALLLK